MNQLTKTAALSPRATFLATYRQQAWSLPDNIIYYITKNPSTSKCYEKMIQTCKHFFVKNPILVVPEFCLDFIDNRCDARFNGILVDLNRIIHKIWAVDLILSLIEYQTESHVLSSIIPKIYKSDIKELCLFQENIFLNDLKFLGSECEKVRCRRVTVMNENGSVIPLEKIFESLPNVNDFEFNFSYVDDLSSKNISSETVSELLKVQHFSNLTRFKLFDIPEVFDIETFYDYIKKNKNTRIDLDFRGELSEAYKIRLQAIIDEIINDESREYNPPFIFFPGITRSSNDKMWELSYPS